MSDSQANDTVILVAHYRLDERQNQGRIRHGAQYPVAERDGLMKEALDAGFDVQYLQSNRSDNRYVMYVSNNGFKQR